MTDLPLKDFVVLVYSRPAHAANPTKPKLKRKP
ncbi:hypothetical protein K227x_46210 [Rubripirellula lacrimiformis]|uniref:Uncharacterized protein n=1 Tax=Rubripirellula lacrimiformis TaxID=1930273 RepID=A0A517NGL5_9BACT|nr:hypothetical protein K227x_46210 [Rubripirellula lacrimiformis]